MAYANSILFYGWSKEDARNVVRALVGEDLVGQVKRKRDDEDDDRNNQVIDIENETLVKRINQKFEELGIGLRFDIFFGGLGCTEAVNYLHFTKHVLANQSCDGSDIGEVSFRNGRLKSMLSVSRHFETSHPEVIVSPRLIHLTVADEK